MAVSHDITRVYRPELIIVYFISAEADDTDCGELVAKVDDHFEEFYRGRVRPEDVYIECTGSGWNALASLQLRLPTLKGEFKTRAYAEAFVAEKGWTDTTLVTRDSAEDHALRTYSVTMLPEGQA